MADLVVSEVFGPTVQGEGPSTGRRAAFVRLGRCDLDCAWCDTPYTWDWSRFDPAAELSTRSVDSVLAAVAAMDVPMVVVTGGEPMLQREGLLALCSSLAEAGFRVEIETNGRHAPAPALAAVVDGFNVSPKLAHSGVERGKAIRPAVLGALAATGKAAFKFVARSADDLDEIAGIVDECGIGRGAVWVMPEGRTPEAIVSGSRALADAVVARGWQLTTRLHVLLWGDERGR